jgi:hypothetical protein
MGREYLKNVRGFCKALVVKSEANSKRLSWDDNIKIDVNVNGRTVWAGCFWL